MQDSVGGDLTPPTGGDLWPWEATAVVARRPALPHHSDVIVIKLTVNAHSENRYKMYISDFSTLNINGMAPLCKLIYRMILICRFKLDF